MAAAADSPDWAGLADRLESLANDLMTAVGDRPSAPGEHDNERELDTQVLQLWSLSLSHYAIQIRQMKCVR